MTWADAAPTLWRAAVVALPFVAIAAFALLVSITSKDNNNG
jgi:hypothetical protein